MKTNIKPTQKITTEWAFSISIFIFFQKDLQNEKKLIGNRKMFPQNEVKLLEKKQDLAKKKWRSMGKTTND